jgi:hypothetical protein
MVSFFSSVDPIFYLHHGNLDRLWDVWTRRQTALGRPTLPQGADLATWSNEQFLFFSNEKGQPVSKTRCRRLAQRLRRLRPRSSKVKSPLLRLLLGQRQALSCRCQQLR